MEVFTNRPPCLKGAVERSETGGYRLSRNQIESLRLVPRHLPLGKGGYDSYHFSSTNPYLSLKKQTSLELALFSVFFHLLRISFTSSAVTVPNRKINSKYRGRETRQIRIR